MCDTFIALPSATRDSTLLFSKNSDREPDEAQAIVHVPHQIHAEANVRCTYISIPQVAETYECIISKPFQMRGAEMGVNEHGVVIGNEAVFTKVKFEKHNNGLTGMDMLRLALERCTSSREAIACITGLLTLYGQNACGGYKNKKFYYHNSFLIADPNEAWVLETAGKEWAIEKVKDIRSISNTLSISTQAEQLSSSAMDYAHSRGWWKENTAFNFQKAYSDWLYTTLGRASGRQACTTELSLRHAGKLDVNDCINILKTHNLPEDKFKPSKANTGSVCMHATSLLNPSSTTGSMVAKIRKSGPHTIWLTGTPHPCLSVYIPFFFGTNVLSELAVPGAQPDDSLWWKAELVHRWISKDYRKRKALLETKRQVLQHLFLEKEAALIRNSSSISELEQFSKDCLQEVLCAYSDWMKLIN
ncbi:MAG: C69 family dipeptidase [Cyclobacteriaceae bacterium]|nr:C69 family dipeptidase [Cyclobacteriaceae bacterium]